MTVIHDGDECKIFNADGEMEFAFNESDIQSRPGEIIDYLVECLETIDGDVKIRTAQLAAANARIAELEAQLAKPATIHEVIDDFGESVTAVTL